SLVAIFEAAARETMLLGQLQLFPSSDSTNFPNVFADLCREAGCNRLWAWPCKNSVGTIVAVCFAMWPGDAPQSSSRLPFIPRAADILGVTIGLLCRAHESSSRRAM